MQLSIRTSWRCLKDHHMDINKLKKELVCSSSHSTQTEALDVVHSTANTAHDIMTNISVHMQHSSSEIVLQKLF
jgi:hypothetical protein